MRKVAIEIPSMMPRYWRAVIRLDPIPCRAAGSAAMSESGGRRRVGASGVGTPRGESTVTSASPMPSEVSVVPVSK